MASPRSPLLLFLATGAVLLVLSQGMPEAFKCYNDDFKFLPTDWKQALVDEAPARSVALRDQQSRLAMLMHGAAAGCSLPMFGNPKSVLRCH